MADLRDVELALVDLDRTVYIGTVRFAARSPALAKLRDIGLAVRFVTNTDSITPGALLDRHGGIGIHATQAEVLTPVALARQLLDGLQSPRLLAVASPGIRELLHGFLATRGERVRGCCVRGDRLRAARLSA
jgi:ribonucleotide monophosphatase NagD (HAD superfamily)